MSRLSPLSDSSSPSPSGTSPAPHPLARYGWDDGRDAEFAPYAEQGLVPGRVARVDRGLCDVLVPGADNDGTVVVRADTSLVTPRDPMRIVCTGDWAAVDTAGEQPIVRALLPRRTAFVRSASSKRSDAQVLAANVDHAVIAVSLAAELDLARVERFLALAWESGAQPLIALTKSDLVPDAAGVAHLVADTEATAPGVVVLPVSATTGDGLDALAATVGTGTTVLLGQSGAGKSTLANALVGEDVQRVQATRDTDAKGRHTTTTRTMLPLPGGGVLIDTPGLRGVGLFDADTGVAQVFAEIEALAEECRFHDCGHETEPGCAVREAVEDGTLAQRRLDSFRKLQRENEWIAARTDARLRAEIRRDWKQKQALGRHMMERKRGKQA